MRKPIFPLAVILALTLASAVFSQTCVVPYGYDTVAGNTANSYPWGMGTRPIRMQMCYDTSHFTNSGITSPIEINQLRYRPQPGATTSSWTGGTYNNAVIDLSSARADWSALSTTFDSNHGFDRTNVLTGAVTVLPGNCIGAGIPQPLYITVNLSTPFFYDPTLGDDLLIDLALDGNYTGGSIRAADYLSTNPMASQLYSTAGATATTGRINSSYAMIMEVGYGPASGLYSNFRATPTAGPVPLLVQFTDQTFTSDPGGVTSWAWDLDGDGFVDSTLQNPNFTYTTCGRYTVTLTTTDATHPLSTFTATNLITADSQIVVAADFSATPTMGIVPFTVSFTDTSTGSPTSWAWDLDGDGIVDSTLQNPNFTYNTIGRYDATLTAGNACYRDTETKIQFIVCANSTGNTFSPEILEYQCNEVRGTQASNTASMNIAPERGTVTASDWQSDPGRAGFMGNESGFGCLGISTTTPYKVIDSGWPINFTSSHTIMFWMRWDGSTATSNSYAFGAAGTGTLGRAYWVNGVFRLYNWGTSNITIGVYGATDTRVANTWQHIAMVLDNAAGTAQWYVNGIPDGSATSFTPGTFVYQGGNLMIGSYGTGRYGPFTRYNEMDDFRAYGRALSPAEIQVAMLHENATSSRYDAGCAGPSTVPLIAADQAPTSPNPGYAIRLDGAEPGRSAALVLGFEASAWMGVVPLPYSLDFIFGTGLGCNLHVAPTVFASAVTGTGSVSFPGPIPVGVAGAHVYAQWLIIGTRGAVTSGLDINIERP